MKTKNKKLIEAIEKIVDRKLNENVPLNKMMNKVYQEGNWLLTLHNGAYKLTKTSGGNMPKFKGNISDLEDLILLIKQLGIENRD